MLAKILFAPYLEADEKVIHVFHRHPFVMAKSLLRVLFFSFAIPLFIYYLFPNLLLLCAIIMLVGFIRIIYVVFNWYHDALLITNVSLLAVQWNGFFHKSSSRLEYQMVEGTASEIKGFRRTILNYGNVTVQGGGAPMVIKDVIDPKNVEKKIMMYQEKFVANQNVKDSNTLKALLATMIRQHAQNEGLSEQAAE